jgi:hypothetical protein
LRTNILIVALRVEDDDEFGEEGSVDDDDKGGRTLE